MKRLILIMLGVVLISNVAVAKSDLTCPQDILKKTGITVLTQGEGFTYPLPEGAIIECYAKKLDGSIEDYNEYNDYFVVRNGKLYSNTLHKIYKPKKANKLKKVDRVHMQSDNKTLVMYDPLWEWSVRHHIRVVKIDTKTGEYYMKGTQDNWMWYRNIVSKGYCRVIYPNAEK